MKMAIGNHGGDELYPIGLYVGGLIDFARFQWQNTLHLAVWGHRI